MQRLSKEEIRDIMAAHYGGESPSAIAARMNRDRSTITYHIEKYIAATALGTDLMAVMKVEIQHECIHPSLKCFCCGKLDDILHREDRLRIRALEQEVLRLGGKLPAV